MLQILLNASSASLPKVPPFSRMNGMKLLLSWLRYCCLYRAFFRVALFVVMLLGVLDASLQYDMAAAISALHGLLP